MDPNSITTSPAIPDEQTPIIEKNLEVKPAGAWSRFWAFVIDGLVFGAPALIITLAVYALKGDRISISRIENTDLYGILLLLFYLPYTIYLNVTKGATVGKDAYGLKVVKLGTNENLTYKQATLREMIKVGLMIIPIVGGILYLLNGFTILLSKQKRGIHDRIARSQVLRVKPAWRMRKQVLFFGSYILLGVVVSFVWSYASNNIVSFHNKLYTNEKYRWTIEYDTSKFNPWPWESDENTTQFKKVSKSENYCISSFSITTEVNPSKLSLEDWLILNKDTYSGPTTFIKINNIEGVKYIDSSSYGQMVQKQQDGKVVKEVVPRGTDNIKYILPYKERIFILEYTTIDSQKTPIIECIKNEQTIEEIFRTFKPS